MKHSKQQARHQPKQQRQQPPATAVRKQSQWNIAEFVRQVRSEAIRKVTWPIRQEVLVGTAMVMVIATLVSLFFLVIDQLLSVGLQFLLSF